MTQHPMDNIPVRSLKFDAADSEPVWSQSSPEFAMFINALGVDVPHFERFLVRVMRQYRGELSDPKLLQDVQAIIGQESHHAFNFSKWTQRLADKYPECHERQRKWVTPGAAANMVNEPQLQDILRQL